METSREVSLQGVFRLRFSGEPAARQLATASRLARSREQPAGGAHWRSLLGIQIRHYVPAVAW
jgi:hypothetical protein